MNPKRPGVRASKRVDRPPRVRVVGWAGRSSPTDISGAQIRLAGANWSKSVDVGYPARGLSRALRRVDCGNGARRRLESLICA